MTGSGYTKLYAIPKEQYERFKELENRVEKTLKTDEDESDLLPISSPREDESNSEPDKVAQQGEENSKVEAAAAIVADAVKLDTVNQDSDILNRERETLKDDKGKEEEGKIEENEKEGMQAELPAVDNLSLSEEIALNLASNLTERYEKARGPLPAIRSKKLSIKKSIMKFPDIISNIMVESNAAYPKDKNNNKHKSVTRSCQKRKATNSSTKTDHSKSKRKKKEKMCKPVIE